MAINVISQGIDKCNYDDSIIYLTCIPIVIVGKLAEEHLDHTTFFLLHNVVDNKLALPIWKLYRRWISKILDLPKLQLPGLPS